MAKRYEMECVQTFAAEFLPVQICAILLALCIFGNSCARSDQDRMDRWVNDLTSRDISVCKHAQNELIASGNEALPLVEETLLNSTNDLQVSFLLVVLGNIDPNRYAEILCQYASTSSARYNVVLRYVDSDVVARMDSEHKHHLSELYSVKFKEAKERDKHAISNLLDSLNQHKEE